MRAPEGVAPALPGGDLPLEILLVVDATVQALALEHPDLNLDHVEPARVLGGIVELQPLQDAMRFRGRKGLIRIPGEGLGVDSCAVAKRVGWCAMSRGGRLWR